MTVLNERTADRRPRPASRRVGYAVAIAVNVALLYLINVAPGWAAVPFLSADFADLLGLVNLSVAVGIAVNALYLAYDARWFVALGGVATTGVGLAVLVRLWQVFPFDFAAATHWALVVRWALGFLVAVTVIALIVQVVAVVRAAGQPGDEPKMRR